MPPVSIRRAALAAILAGAVVFGSLAFLATFGPSPASPKLADTIVVDNESYYFENVTVREPGWSNFSFLGVIFGFHAWCSMVNPGGVRVCGNVSPSFAVAYPFSFWVGAANPAPWFSPNGHEGIIYEPYSGGLARLLVAV
jgi:hypothetical protein